MARGIQDQSGTRLSLDEAQYSFQLRLTRDTTRGINANAATMIVSNNFRSESAYTRSAENAARLHQLKYGLEHGVNLPALVRIGSRLIR